MTDAFEIENEKILRNSRKKSFGEIWWIGGNVVILRSFLSITFIY